MAPVSSRIPKKEYKDLLNWLQDSIRKNEFEDMKFLLDVPEGESESMSTSIKLFQYMEGMETLSPSNMAMLKETLDYIGRKDLVKAVKAYEEKSKNSPPQVARARTTSRPRSAEMTEKLKKLHLSAKEDSEEFTEEYFKPKKEPKEVFEEPSPGSLYPTESMDHYGASNVIIPISPSMSYDPFQPLKKEIPLYKMTSEPRGICLIISNSNFSKARENQIHLGDRPGTILDKEKLEKTFERLKFKVVVFEDLTAEIMYKSLSYYACSEDHSNFDCFVCCIMTHGNDSGLYGVDGNDLKIADVTAPFKPIQSLQGKPKLFFFQACRGISETKSFVKDNFGGGDGTSFMQQYTAPLGSDYFIGYATPPGYVAWIGAQGSWYISALCQAFDDYASHYDIHHITTQINEIVSKYATHEGDKQIPMPSHTLRKILYFFPENLR